MRTVQAELEKAAAKLTGLNPSERLKVSLAGRTDTGVHASGQVANFQTDSAHSLETFVRGLNALLPFDIAVLAAEEVDARFHARFSATSRAYEYTILNRAVRSPLDRRFATLVTAPLNFEVLQEASKVLVGEHNFASFAGMGWGVKSESDEADEDGSAKNSTVRRLLQADWVQRGDQLIFLVEANAFLPHMVRNLVGTLLLVGTKKLSPDEFKKILVAADRRQAGPTAPANGLCLVRVHY